MFRNGQLCHVFEQRCFARSCAVACKACFSRLALFSCFSCPMKNLLRKIKQLPLELAFWCIALTSLWWLDPYGSHYTLCPLHQLGIEWCPGCGLGRAISLLMNGEVAASWQLHPLGGFALAVILYRIFEILKHLQ